MIKVLKAGFYSTIQDKGRQGSASIGVPVSGAMDTYAADIANSIVGNSLQDAVLENVFGGLQIQFLVDTIICISGGHFSPKINGKLIHLNTRIIIRENDILSFGKIQYGVRCYVSVKGGFLTEEVLGSKSMYQQITKNAILRKDALLPIKKISVPYEDSYASIKVLKSHFTTNNLTCYEGPEFYLLKEHQKKILLQQTFSVSKDNNRMGYRLNEVLENSLASILTSAVLPGTVQLTPSGKLIVLMRDCQVTGGYPRVLQLTEAAINQLAQKTTNACFSFEQKKHQRK